MIRRCTAFALVGAILVITALTGCSAVVSDVISVFQITETVEEAHRVKAGTVLEIQNTNGSITVRSGGGDAVHIHAVKRAFSRADLNELQIEVTIGAAMTIRSVHPRSASSAGIDYEITLPPTVELKAAASSNGEIRVQDVRGDVLAMTSNGSIRLTNVDGYVSATTSNGSIHIEGCRGVAGARTSNGNIVADITGLREDVELRSSNGSVNAYLVTDLSANISLATSNGRVSAEHENLVVSTSSRTSLTGQVGEGGMTLRMRTSNGNVNVHQIQD